MCAKYYDAFRALSEKEIKDGIEIRWAAHYECGPSYHVDRIHKRYFFIYITEGKCLYKTSSGAMQTLEQGNIIIYHPFEPQCFRTDPDCPLSYVGACFSGDKIQTLIESSLLQDLHCQKIGINNRLIRFFDELIQEILVNKCTLSLLGTVLKILGEIEFMLANKLQFDAHTDPIRNLLIQAHNYMLLNYNKKLSLEEIAAVTGYSVSRFQYLFKKYFGQSASDFLIQERIEKAKELLLGSIIPINEICFSVGFADPYYFSKMFKQKTGISPREFRRLQGVC